MQSFTKAELQLLAEALNTNFNLEWVIQKTRKGSLGQEMFILKLSRVQVPLLLPIVKPYFLPEMLYKLGITSTTPNGPTPGTGKTYKSEKAIVLKAYKSLNDHDPVVLDRLVMELLKSGYVQKLKAGFRPTFVRKSLDEVLLLHHFLVEKGYANASSLFKHKGGFTLKTFCLTSFEPLYNVFRSTDKLNVEEVSLIFSQSLSTEFLESSEFQELFKKRFKNSPVFR